MATFKERDLVFAKVGKYPSWPGVILCEGSKPKKEEYYVSFFGSNDLRLVDVQFITRYTDTVLQIQKERQEDHTKLYIKGLEEIEERHKENQDATNNETSEKKRSTRSRSSSSISSSSSSRSSTSSAPPSPSPPSSSSSPSSSTTEQSKRLRKPNFVTPTKSSAKRIKLNDTVSEEDEPVVPVENEGTPRDKSSPILKKVPAEPESSDSNNSITYTLDLEEINSQLAEHCVNITFSYVRRE